MSKTATAFDAVSLMHAGIERRLQRDVINKVIEVAVQDFRETITKQIEEQSIEICVESLEYFKHQLKMAEEIEIKLSINGEERVVGS